MCKTCGCPSASRIEQLKIYIKGIMSSEMAGKIEKSLLGLKGVLHTRINAQDGETSISYKPGQSSLESIAQELDKHNCSMVTHKKP